MILAITSRAKVLNRGTAPVAFLIELINWAKSAPDEIFAVNSLHDIYSKVKPELGPYTSLLHRKAVMLEVLRVLAGFESSWDWTEGVDTSRLGEFTPENSEAGAWQVSWDSRFLFPASGLYLSRGVDSGVKFQQRTKFDHQFAMDWVARLLRCNTRHHGPLYKGEIERTIIRKSLRGAEQSIYLWLRRDCVAEFEKALQS